MNEFVQRKSLHIMAGIRGVRADDLKVLFRLMAVPDQTISLEEIYQTDGLVYLPNRRGDSISSKKKKDRYEDMAKKAAGEIGQDW